MSALDPGCIQDELPQLVDRLESEFARLFTYFRIPEQDAEDLLQDALVLFITKRPKIVVPDAWLIGTLRFRCLLYWRKRRRRLLETVDETLLMELAGGIPPRQNNDDLARDLSGAIGRLPDRCRSLLRLRYGLGCDDPEVAHRLGYSPTGIRKIAHRCLSALTHQMLASGYPMPAAPSNALRGAD
ncbi:MAG: sigma-70 family RNA polymerase sigma factor [Thermoanaerobaculia bacterium]